VIAEDQLEGCGAPLGISEARRVGCCRCRLHSSRNSALSPSASVLGPCPPSLYGLGASGRGDVRLKDGWAALSPIPGSFNQPDELESNSPVGRLREGDQDLPSLPSSATEVGHARGVDRHREESRGARPMELGRVPPEHFHRAAHFRGKHQSKSIPRRGERRSRPPAARPVSSPGPAAHRAGAGSLQGSVPDCCRRRFPAAVDGSSRSWRVDPGHPGGPAGKAIPKARRSTTIRDLAFAGARPVCVPTAERSPTMTGRLSPSSPGASPSPWHTGGARRRPSCGSRCRMSSGAPRCSRSPCLRPALARSRRSAPR